MAATEEHPFWEGAEWCSVLPPDNIIVGDVVIQRSLVTVPPSIDVKDTTSSSSSVDIALVGVPFDGGVTNRPGARYGPREVRSSSVSFVRRTNQATGIAPFEYDLSIADVGDAFVSSPYELIGAHSEIEGFFEKMGDTTALSVGGDHSVTLPILRALSKRLKKEQMEDNNSVSSTNSSSPLSPPPLGLIHIDAHADTGDDYGGSRFHHGAPFKIAVDEKLIDPLRTIQIGIRGSLNHAEMWKFSHTSGMRVMYMEEFAAISNADVIEEIKRIVGSGPVYVSFDIDVLDPAYAPGTGTPEIGGMTSLQAQQLIRGLEGLDIVGGDVVEVSPPFDNTSGITSLAGAALLFELLCVVAPAAAKRKTIKQTGRQDEQTK
mmetsp:Transcript_24054/g.31312  ORF Transcript_24054/g.31312 Transcript_24054/m.31312 type:complete len:375 (+) Transcript_24054:18-1142(+)